MKNRFFRITSLAATGAALLLGATATAKHTPGHGGVAPADKKFMMEAAQGGMAEVKLGQLALKNASHADVKAFGGRMVTDHGKANAELKQLAAQKGVKLPKSVGPKHQPHIMHLSKLQGAAFDKAYMSHMVKDHEMDVKAFQKASTSAHDSDLKAWAGKTLPTLQEHLRMAKETADRLGAQTARPVQRHLATH
jgi:putative membrane protein